MHLVTVRAQHIDDVAGAAGRLPQPPRQLLDAQQRRDRDGRRLVQVVAALGSACRWTWQEWSSIGRLTRKGAARMRATP